MINLLLVDNDITRFKDIVNNVIAKLPNVVLYGVAVNKEDAFKIIKGGKVNAILINNKQNNILLDELIEFISEKNYNYLKNSIISFNKSNILDEKYNSYIYEYITTSSNIFKHLLDVLEKYCKEYENKYNLDAIKRIVTTELKYLRFNFSYNGTRYITDVILELYKKKTYNNDYNLQKDIYPIIAKKYNKSVNNIKSSISLSTRMMCVNCEEEKMCNYFYLCVGEIPKAKEVICIIFDNVLNKEKIS